MKARASALLALALLPLAAGAGAPSVASVAWGAPGAPIEAAPGDTGRTLSVTILNDDDDAFENVVATLGPAGGITPTSGTSALSGTFDPGELWTASFVVDVAQNASFSSELPLRLSMRYASSDATTTRTLDVPARLTGRPTLTLDADGETLPAWSETALDLRLANVGTGPAGGIVVRASTNGTSASLADDGVRLVGGLDAGAARTVRLSFLTAAPGAASLLVQLSYTNAAGASVTETRTLTTRVIEVEATPLVVKLLAADLEPGAPGSATFRLSNTGEGARDLALRVTLPATASAVNGSDVQFLGTLAAGSARDVRVELRPSSQARDTVDVALSLTWVDAEGVSRSATHRDALPLRQPAIGQVDLRLLTPHVAAGTSDRLDFTLRNLQDAPLRDVRVAFTLPSTGAAPFTPVNATDLQALGELPPGASRSVTLELVAARSASDVYPIAATVTWRGEDDALRNETFRFGVVARGSTQLVLTDASADLDEDVLTVDGVLTNLGTGVALNVHLRVGEGGAGVEPSSAQLLGDIASNAAVAFAIETEASAFPPTVPLVLTWNDAYGEQHHERLVAPVREAAADPGETDTDDAPIPTSPALLLVALAAVALLARRRS